jgi:hypothetical protein
MPASQVTRPLLIAGSVMPLDARVIHIAGRGASAWMAEVALSRPSRRPSGDACGCVMGSARRNDESRAREGVRAMALDTFTLIASQYAL